MPRARRRTPERDANASMPSKSRGSRGWKSSSRAPPSSGRGRGNNATSFRTIAKKSATLATTGTKKIPKVVKVYTNTHSRVALYDNGGTVTKNWRGGLETFRTPQVRSQGAKGANYRTINEKNQPYCGYTGRGSMKSGRAVANGPRMQEHKAGRGAQVTREDKKHHCDRVVLHATTRHAIEGEKKLYKETKKTHGTSTRGAWDVERRSLG